MSSRVSPASPMAARHASTVMSMSVLPRGRPIADWPMPEMTARRSSGSVVLIRPVLGRYRPEQGKVDVVIVLEDDLDGHAGPHLLGIHVDQVGSEPDAVLLIDGHQTDQVRVTTGDPFLHVAGVATTVARPLTTSGETSFDRQSGQTGEGGCNECTAILATQEPESTIRPLVQKKRLSWSMREGADGRDHGQSPGHRRSPAVQHFGVTIWSGRARPTAGRGLRR